STSRYLPPSGTAGLARSLVRGNRRVPAPPPMMTATISEGRGKGTAEVTAESYGGQPGRASPQGHPTEPGQPLQRLQIPGPMLFRLHFKAELGVMRYPPTSRTYRLMPAWALHLMLVAALAACSNNAPPAPQPGTKEANVIVTVQNQNTADVDVF